MRKPAFYIYENKDADQLCSNCAADQRLCFRYTDSTIPLLSTGCPRKNETHFQFLFSLKLFNPYTCLYTSFRYIIYPHLYKITAQLLLYILRYCKKTKTPCFHFPPEIGFSHIYLVDYLLFLDDQYISFLPSFSR